jgi:hypothetical protein
VGGALLFLVDAESAFEVLDSATGGDSMSSSSEPKAANKFYLLDFDNPSKGIPTLEATDIPSDWRGQSSVGLQMLITPPERRLLKEQDREYR